MIDGLVAAIARRELARAVRFDPNEDPVLPPADDVPRLLYLHVPFCESLCPYCSFHRVVFEERLCRDYFAALRREIRLYAERGFRFSGTYVGGGTPTVLVDELRQTLDLARDRFGLRQTSVETNPDHLTDERLAVLQDAGVNRLSVGIQSFDDGLLRKMNRYDRCGSGSQSARHLAAALGRFETVNADMMFNFPTQDPAMLDRDLDTLLELEVDQITFYPLMVSDTTRDLLDKAVGRINRARERGLYERIVERLAPTYARSSAWCFSRAAAGRAIDEYIVDHDEYAGLGSGAIGYLAGTVYANTFDIRNYIARLAQGMFPLRAARRFGAHERARYDFIMKLFSGKLYRTEMRRKHGNAARGLWPETLALRLVGALDVDGQTLRLTARGYYTWVLLMREFFTAVNNLRDEARRELPTG